MTAAGMALLAGLIAAPMALLWLGHRLRDRSRRQVRAFWGGLIGHAVGLIAMLLASMSPPVGWAEGGALRELAVHWAPLLLAAAGAAAGALRAAPRSDPETSAESAFRA